MWMRHAIVLLALFGSAAAAGGDRISPSRTSPTHARPTSTQIKPGTIAFSDHTGSSAVDSEAALFHFDEWAEKHPTEKKFLALFPSYTEPTVPKLVNGTTSQVLRKALHVCRAGALRGRQAAGRHRPVALRDLAVLAEDRSGHHPQGAGAVRHRTVQRRSWHRQRQSGPHLVHRPRHADLHPIELQARGQDPDGDHAGQQNTRRLQESRRPYRLPERIVGARTGRYRSGRACRN